MTIEAIYGLVAGVVALLFGIALVWIGLTDIASYASTAHVRDEEPRETSPSLSDGALPVGCGLLVLAVGSASIATALGVDLLALVGISSDTAARVGWGVFGAIFTAVGVGLWWNARRLAESEPPAASESDVGPVASELLRGALAAALFAWLTSKMSPTAGTRLGAGFFVVIGIVAISGTIDPDVPATVLNPWMAAVSIVDTVGIGILVFVGIIGAGIVLVAGRVRAALGVLAYVVMFLSLASITAFCSQGFER